MIDFTVDPYRYFVIRLRILQYTGTN